MKKVKVEEKIDEEVVADRLSRRYPAPAWSFLKRIRRGTGYSTAIRTADAMAMSLFPSRGFEVQGFEIKVSRNDWKKELADPEKSIELQQFCHRWWIVVPTEDIVQLNELPQNWGLIIAKKSGNFVTKEAPFLEAELPDYPFLASLFRNMNENFVPRSELNKKIEESKESWKRGWGMDSEKLVELKKKLEEFEIASGIRIDNWDKDHKEKGRIVKLVLEMESDVRWRFESLHNHALKVVEAFKKIEEDSKEIVKILK